MALYSMYALGDNTNTLGHIRTHCAKTLTSNFIARQISWIVHSVFFLFLEQLENALMVVTFNQHASMCCFVDKMSSTLPYAMSVLAMCSSTALENSHSEL